MHSLVPAQAIAWPELCTFSAIACSYQKQEAIPMWVPETLVKWRDMPSNAAPLHVASCMGAAEQAARSVQKMTNSWCSRQNKSIGRSRLHCAAAHTPMMQDLARPTPICRDPQDCQLGNFRKFVNWKQQTPAKGMPDVHSPRSAKEEEEEKIHYAHTASKGV